jgi:exosome complex RNA-binding protein Rrp42 (RNase PH superfamily)
MLTADHALVSAVLLEQDDYWQLEDRSMFSAACMAAIATLKDLPAPRASSHNSILQKNTVKINRKNLPH